MGVLRLQHRILVPFVLVAVATAVASAWATWLVSVDALQERVRSQLVGASDVVTRSELALNPAILQMLSQVLRADIVTASGGTVLASSTSDPQASSVGAALAAMRGGPTGQWPVVENADCGTPCLVVYRPLAGQPDTMVALVAETSRVRPATRALARAIVVAGFASLLVMVLVGQAVVRRVTAPIERLIGFVRELSPDQPRRAVVESGEVGALAETFNGMLDRLETSRKALVESEKLALSGLFAARVAHDIRNPLSSIKMQSQLLRDRYRQQPEDAATLTSILHDIDQVESVIRDLLELARPGEFRLERTPLATVVRDALDRMHAQLTHRRIAVTTTFADDVPDVRLDASRFRQALLNLLANAAEALISGGTIEVIAHRADAGIALEIRDDGVGIDAELAPHVFEPFVSSKRDGVGLGLVNVKAVVEGHGGRIAIAPRQGAGTCVTIWLPPAAASD